MSTEQPVAVDTAPSFELTRADRHLVLWGSFLAWMFAGFEMAIVQLGSRPAMVDFLGPDNKANIGKWVSWNICAYLAGAATGGLIFGWLGDRQGRVRALGWSVLCYSLLTGLSYFASDPYWLLVLRFLACLGVGGTWPNAVALVSEAWPDFSRPTLAGLLGTAANVGIVVLALICVQWKLQHDQWRWLMLVGGSPAIVGLLVLFTLPESPRWLAERFASSGQKPATPVAEVFRPPLLRLTLIGIALGAVPLVGSLGSANWVTPWSDQVGGVADPHLKAWTQATRSGGAALGSLIGGWLANRFGRRITYFSISLASLLVSGYIFRFLTPLDGQFAYWVFALGFVGTIYFGWLPLYLPELFPTRVRSTGTGITFNFGRYASVLGVLGTGELMWYFKEDYGKVGTITSLVYVLGMIVVWFAPDTTKDRRPT